jgi:hypothetical protein
VTEEEEVRILEEVRTGYQYVSQCLETLAVRLKERSAEARKTGKDPGADRGSVNILSHVDQACARIRDIVRKEKPKLSPDARKALESTEAAMSKLGSIALSI